VKKTAVCARSGLLYQLAAGLLFIAVLGLVRSNVESGMNDDWSFIRTVQVLAETGHLQYNGWSAPLIGFQAYWAALFVKLFGFSFLAVRASSWVITLLGIPVLWRLLRRVELSEAQAFFGLLAFLLSPLTLPNLATFMTDMPAFFLFAASLLSAIQAWNSNSERSAMLWTCASTLCGLLSGSVRQIYWLSGITFLIVLAFTRLRSSRGRLLIAGCIAVTIICGIAASRWLAQQPYVPADSTLHAWREDPWQMIVQSSVLEMFRFIVGLAVLSVPLSLPFAVLQARRMGLGIHLLIACCAVAVTYWLAEPLPWLGNTITNYGVLMSGTVSVGDKPEVLSRAVVLLLGSLGIASSAYALLWTMARIRTFSLRRLKQGALCTGLGQFTALSLPFLLAYVVVLAIRAPAFGMYDRYLIPHLFVVIALALGVYARQSNTVSKLSWTAFGIFAIYSIATTHDYFADARAKLNAANSILRAGHARATIIGGFEFDLLTEAERTGHINSGLVQFPKDAYHQTEDCDGEDDVDKWWRSLAPSLKARYVVSLTPIQSLQPSEFSPVAYRRWLPPARSRVYIERVPADQPPLTCAPGSGE
jgi:hypothetical protein